MTSDRQTDNDASARTVDLDNKLMRHKLDLWMTRSRQLQIRAVSALTGMLYIVASQIDPYVVHGDVLALMTTVHLYILPPVLFLISLSTFRKESSKLTRFLLTIAPVGAAMGNMFVVAQIENPPLYLTEVYLILFWIFTVSGLRLRLATVSALLTVAVVFLATYFLLSLTPEVLIMHCFWMLAAFSFGFLAAYLLERSDTALFGQHQQLMHSAVTDQLTGLSNRVKLDEILRDELDRSRRFGHRFGLIIMDLDYFKAVNDTYGHQAGDEMLIEVGRLILEHLRSTDRAVRWGGEEFILIYLETDRAEILQLAEALRQKIEAHPFKRVGAKTASFGATVYRDGDTAGSIIQRADKALYRAKEHGRNRVEYL